MTIKYNHSGLYPERTFKKDNLTLYEYKTVLNTRFDGLTYKYDYVLNNEELLCSCLMEPEEEIQELRSHYLSKNELIWQCLTSENFLK